ncbi:hypothetical protein CEXT_516151, partial [Caerostris extrusa]
MQSSDSIFGFGYDYWLMNSRKLQEKPKGKSPSGVKADSLRALRRQSSTRKSDQDWFPEISSHWKPKKKTYTEHHYYRYGLNIFQ